MHEIVVHFLEGMSNLDWKAIGSLLILGTLLIIVNSTTHYIQQRITERRTAFKRSQSAFEDHASPLMKNSDNLVARITNLTCGFVSHTDATATDSLLADAAAYETRLQQLGANTLTWSEQTAMRFLQYVWSVGHFRRGVAHVINNPLIEDIEYFVTDKIPLVLRGRLYGRDFITRELYEEATAFFPSRDLASVEGPTVLDLLKILREDAVARRVFSKIVSFFTLGAEPVQLANDHFFDTPVAAHYTLPPRAQEDLKKAKLSFVFGVAPDDAEEKIKELFKKYLQISEKQISVRVGRRLLPSKRLLAGTAPLADIPNRKQLREFLDQVGREIMSAEGKTPEKAEKRALGEDRSEALIVFPYNTPTMTVTALWCRGKIVRGDWMPLVERRRSRRPDGALSGEDA